MSFCFCSKSPFLKIFLLPKFILFSLILIYNKEKELKLFYNNLGIHAVIICFCFVLIDLVNDYKIVCIMVFMKIVCIMVFHMNC